MEVRVGINHRRRATERRSKSRSATSHPGSPHERRGQVPVRSLQTDPTLAESYEAASRPSSTATGRITETEADGPLSPTGQVSKSPDSIEKLVSQPPGIHALCRLPPDRNRLRPRLHAPSPTLHEGSMLPFSPPSSPSANEQPVVLRIDNVPWDIPTRHPRLPRVTPPLFPARMSA
jgi:hypothetical protein